MLKKPHVQGSLGPPPLTQARTAEAPRPPTAPAPGRDTGSPGVVLDGAQGQAEGQAAAGLLSRAHEPLQAGLWEDARQQATSHRGSPLSKRGRGPHSPSPAPPCWVASVPGWPARRPAPAGRGMGVAVPPAPAPWGPWPSAPRRSPGSPVSAGTSRPRRSGPPADLGRAEGACDGAVYPLLQQPGGGRRSPGPAHRPLHTGWEGIAAWPRPQGPRRSTAAQNKGTRASWDPPRCLSAHSGQAAPSTSGCQTLGFCCLPDSTVTAPLVWD